MGCLGTVYEMSLWDYHYAVQAFAGQVEKPERRYPTDEEFEEMLRSHGIN